VANPNVRQDPPPLADQSATRSDARGQSRSSSVLTRLGQRLPIAGLAVPACLGILIVSFSIALPTTFLTTANWRGMIVSQAVLIILALAVTLPLRAGDFDLSIGAVAALSSVVTAITATHWHWNPAVAVLAGLGVALLVGIVNAIAVLVAGIDAFIATLGTMTVITGLTLMFANTSVIINIPQPLITLSRKDILGLPASAFYGWILAAVLWYIYEFTPYGRRSLFVRGNQQAARLAGIQVNRVRALAFIWCSVISGVGGIVLLGTIGAGDPGIGSQYLLQPYAAAFLGATAIQMGRFNVLGTIFGLYLIVVGVTGLQLLGASTEISQVFYGSVLLVAVGLSRLAARRGRGVGS
jgi:ribose transport system permease protein